MGGFPVPENKKNHKLVGKRHLNFFARGTLAMRLKNLIVERENKAVVELGIFPRLLVHQCWMYIASLWSGARSWGSMHREILHFIKAGAFLAQTKLSIRCWLGTACVQE